MKKEHMAQHLEEVRDELQQLFEIYLIENVFQNQEAVYAFVKWAKNMVTEEIYVTRQGGSYHECRTQETI